MKRIVVLLITSFTSSSLCSLFDGLYDHTLIDRQKDKRSLQFSSPDYEYNLLFQEVLPLNRSYAPVKKKGKVRKLKKLPLRFQEVVEVTTENTPSQEQYNIQEVKEIKRYSVEELERQFPSILKEETTNLLQNYPYDEVYEVKKLPTRFTPSQPIRKVKPVYNYRDKIKEEEANRGILREVNLGSNKFKRNNSYQPGETGESEESSLFEVVTSPDGEQTQIIISLSTNPQFKVYNGGAGGESIGPSPPAPPPSDILRDPAQRSPPAPPTDSYGIPLDLETTNRPPISDFSRNKGRNVVFEDNFGSTGTFSFDYSKLSQPLKSPSISIDFLPSSDVENFSSDLVLTTPRLPSLTTERQANPQSTFSSYSAPLAPQLRPAAPSYSIDVFQPSGDITSDNSYRAPLGPPITSDNSYQAPLSPPITSDNSYQAPLGPPITSDNSYRAPLGPPVSYSSYKNSEPFQPEESPAQPPAPPPSPPAPPPSVTTFPPATVHHVHTHTHNHNYRRPRYEVSYSVTSQSSSVSNKQPRPNNPSPRPVYAAPSSMDSMTAPLQGKYHP